MKLLSIFAILALLSCTLTVEIRRKGEEAKEKVDFTISIPYQAGGIHPEYDWLQWGVSNKYEDPSPFYDLLEVRFQEPPTAGKGQYVEMDVFTK